MRTVDPNLLTKILKRPSNIYVKPDDPSHVELQPQIVDLFRQWHAESGFRDIPFSPKKIESVVQHLWDAKKTGLLLGAFEKDRTTGINDKPLGVKDRIVGVLAARLGPLHFSDELAATVEHWYVHPDYRTTTAAVKLLVAFRLWAAKNNCRFVMIPTNSGARMKTTDALLRKIGFRMVGATYAAEL